MPITSNALLAPLGRLLLASPFLISGSRKLAAPEAVAGYIASGGLPASATLAIAVGAFELIAGLALLVGWRARPAAALLALFTLAASVLFHPFWAVPAEQQSVVQLLFTKNMAILGGLLCIAAGGAGLCSLDNRVERMAALRSNVFEA